jgi:hypothetical protein
VAKISELIKILRDGPVQPFGKGSLVRATKFTKKDLADMGAELETSTGSLVSLQGSTRKSKKDQ